MVIIPMIYWQWLTIPMMYDDVTSPVLMVNPHPRGPPGIPGDPRTPWGELWVTNSSGAGWAKRAKMRRPRRWRPAYSGTRKLDRMGDFL